MVKTLDYFYFRNHLCITFELLSINLYEFIKNNVRLSPPVPRRRCSCQERLFLAAVLTEIYLRHACS
jgi:hypothetical protein